LPRSPHGLGNEPGDGNQTSRKNKGGRELKRARLVRSRAYTSIANLGYGYDIFGICLDIGADEVFATPSPKWKISIEGVGSEGIPTQVQKNTAGLAAQCLLKNHGIKSAVHLHIRKGIRPGSGLGSSAASSAASVLAVSRLFGIPAEADELILCASEGEKASAGTSHADNVAAAILGGFTVVTKKPPMTLLQIEPPEDLRIVVAMPSIHITTRASRKALPKNIDLVEYAEGCARASMTVAALASGQVAHFANAIEGSFIDQKRSRLIPGYDDVEKKAKKAGALAITLSGAGPSVAAILSRRTSAKKVGAAVKAGFRSAGIESEIFTGRPARGAQIVEVA